MEIGVSSRIPEETHSLKLVLIRQCYLRKKKKKQQKTTQLLMESNGLLALRD